MVKHACQLKAGPWSCPVISPFRIACISNTSAAGLFGACTPRMLDLKASKCAYSHAQDATGKNIFL
jgi:hypothetical protein